MAPITWGTNTAVGVSSRKKIWGACRDQRHTDVLEIVMAGKLHRTRKSHIRT
jgi:hypothetical protein